LTLAEPRTPVADDWVQRMIDSPGRSGHLKSGEHTTHYLEWGDASNPQVLLLLHGFRGHAHWWDFVAPWFAADYRVIAPDFSGMGDSSPRLNYQRSDFVAEVRAILEMIGPKEVTLVGHSFGGRIAVFAAHEYPQLLARAIVIDTNIGFADQPLRTRFVHRPKKIYPEFKTACARFRFVPDEPPILPRIMQHLAAHSIKQQDGGYTWKFDEKPIGSGWEQVAEGELLAISICRWTSSPGNSARWCRRHWRIESARLCAMGADPLSYRPPTIMFPWISPWRWLLCCARCLSSRSPRYTATGPLYGPQAPWRPAAARHVSPGTSRR